MYQKQIESKKWRYWNTIFANEFNDEVYKELYSKYFKKFYRGKMTKRFARISKKLQEPDKFNADDYLSLFKSFNK